MSLCLLSRRPLNFGLSLFAYCFQLAKVMIVLLLSSALEHSTGSTSQPRQQKRFYKQGPPTLSLVFVHSIPRARSPRRFNDLLIANGKARKPRHLFAAATIHSLSASDSPNHSPVSINVCPENEVCVVCDAHSSAICPVCEQNFCSNHLYVCLDCDSQFCGSCLDDHRVHGHWSDSDTNAELAHAWREKLVLAVLLRVEKCISTSISDRPQCSSNNQFSYSSIVRVFPDGKATKANGKELACPSADCNWLLSGILHPNILTSFFARVMRDVCSCVASYAAHALVNSSSQLSLEVCL